MKSILNSQGFVLFSSFTTLGAAGLLPNTFHVLNRRDSQVWPYGVIGDSWGSGVSYSTDVLYDGNLDDCLRTKESHGPQMEADSSWVSSNPSGLRDAACSGSILGDIVAGQHQIGKVGSPDVVIMTSGGNNAGFGHIVDVCIYHSAPTHYYGNPYWSDPDRSGECAKALDDATGYITDPNRMAYDLTRTLDDLLADPAVSGNSDFLLYLTGYAQFFGTDYDDWCDSQYWSIPTFNPSNIDPYLSKNLRQDFNDRVSKVNDLYKFTAQSDKYKSKVRYIDVDSHFAGHRFCEPGSNYNAQVNTDTHFEDVYLWNLNYPWQVTGQGAPSTQAARGNVSAQEASDAFDGQPITAWNSVTGPGGNQPNNGWRLRPFHPRYTGYTAIKEAIFAQLQADGRPPANPTSNPPATSSTAPAPSYATGWCGMHVIQYQKNEAGSTDPPPNPEYQIDVSLFDANGKAINLKNCNGCTTTARSVALNGQADTIDSDLPFGMDVTVGAVDTDPILFKYGDQSWGSNDQAHHSNFGAFDSGKREGDTGFNC